MSASWSNEEVAALTTLAAEHKDGKKLARAFAAAGYTRTPQALYSYLEFLDLRSKYPELRLSLYRLARRQRSKSPAARITARPHVTAHLARVKHLINAVAYGDMTKIEAFDAIKKLVQL